MPRFTKITNKFYSRTGQNCANFLGIQTKHPATSKSQRQKQQWEVKVKLLDDNQSKTKLVYFQINRINILTGLYISTRLIRHVEVFTHYVIDEEHAHLWLKYNCMVKFLDLFHHSYFGYHNKRNLNLSFFSSFEIKVWFSYFTDAIYVILWSVVKIFRVKRGL